MTTMTNTIADVLDVVFEMRRVAEIAMKATAEYKADPSKYRLVQLPLSMKWYVTEVE